MIPDWQTNTIFFSDLLRTNSKYHETYTQICDVLNEFNIPFHFLESTKDIWARDYMPVQVTKDKLVEYRYDPDYLQGTRKGFRDLKTYPDVVCATLGVETRKSEVLIDGGNVVKSENAVILTDKIVHENKFSFSRTQLIEELEKTFEIDKVILIPWDRQEPYGHADGMIRFIDNNSVLINWMYRNGDENFKTRILKPLREKGISHEWLELKNKKMKKHNWAYINFLQTKDIILIPKFGADDDSRAFDELNRYFKSYSDNRIHSIESDQIARRDGALNCISWTSLM